MSAGPNLAQAPGALPVASGRTTLLISRQLFAGKRLALSAVAIVLLFGATLGLVVPWGFGRIVDIVIVGGGTGSVLLVGVVMVLAAVASAALTGIGIALSAQLFETALANLRARMVDAVLRLSQARVEEAGSGDLVSRATDDVTVVSDAIARAVPALARSGFMIAVTAAGFAVLDWRFLLVVLLVAPVYYLGARGYLHTAPPVYRAEREAMAGRAHHLLGAIRGLPTVHAFDLTQRSADRIGLGSWAVVRWTMRARIVQNRLFGRANLAEFIGMATIVVLGSFLLGRDMVTVGVVTSAMLLFLRLFDPVNALLFVMDAIQSAAASLARIVGVIVLADEVPTPSGQEPDDRSGRASVVSAQSVGFAYPGTDRRVVDDVSITVAAGQSVAVVGASGAGKSTLATLLAGVHPPGTGEVSIGGRNLQEVPVSEVPMLVTQDVHVFAGPLRDDLRMAAPDADDDALRAALDLVGAGEWLSLLEDGLDTVVGAGGTALTPLRSQQLALARLWLADPSVVILDEATADADSADADALEEAALAVTAGRTAVLIAHRLSQAARADRILVMERGRIVEDGSHESLRSSGGRYAALWSAWGRYRQPHDVTDEAGR